MLFHTIALDDLHTVLSEVLGVASRWKSFGLALHLKPSLISTIEASNHDPERCLCRTLEEFLKKNYDFVKFGQPTWKLICQAVEHRAGGNDRALAETIAKAYSTVVSKGFYTYIIKCTILLHIGTPCLPIPCSH